MSLITNNKSILFKRFQKRISEFPFHAYDEPEIINQLKLIILDFYISVNGDDKGSEELSFEFNISNDENGSNLVVGAKNLVTALLFSGVDINNGRYNPDRTKFYSKFATYIWDDNNLKIETSGTNFIEE